MKKQNRTPAPARHHPLVADVLSLLDPPVPVATLSEDVLRRRFDGLNQRDSHGANVLAVAASVLAASHLLDDRAEPLVGAEDLVEHVHAVRERLLPDVAAMLSEVRDRVALDDGRRAFVGRARDVLQAVEALATDVLDVREERVIVVGGRTVPIEYEKHGETRCRAASLGNQEGRLILLAGAGRGPRRGFTNSVVMSRVKKGLTSLGRADQLHLGGDTLQLQPSLRLTSRARAAAAGIRDVKSPTR